MYLQMLQKVTRQY